MKSIKNTIIILLLTFGLLTPIAQAKSPSLLLQEGLYAEETEGDLEKAIALYEQVLEQYKDVERLAARATYQLGICHLKKSEKEKAAEYFQEVIDYYPEQKGIGQRAQKQLEKVRPLDDIISRSYVIHYKALDQSKIALELLNRNHPKGVRTHHANRYKKNGITINSICTDNEIGKDKIVAAINDSNELEVVKVDSPNAGRKIFLPECDTTTFDLLDLPSGELINSEPGGNIIDLKDPDGMGHLYFDNANGHPYIVGIRGTRLQLHRAGKLVTTRPERVSRGIAAYYAIPSLPCQYQVTTGTGEKYELKVLSADKTGAKIEYYKITDPKEWVQGLVEDFFKHNYRDITSRKTIEWGNPVTDATGNVSISYKYEMTIWDKDKYLANEIFTFDKNGKYLSARKVEGFPKPLGKIVFLPDADTPEVNAVLDLASGELLPTGTGQQQLTIFRELGKGDLAYDRMLICLRGAKAQRIGTGPYGEYFGRLKVMDQIEDATVYQLDLGHIPGRYLVTTGDGEDYEINILSADKTGIRLGYKRGNPG